jgi:hypothetical protein
LIRATPRRKWDIPLWLCVGRSNDERRKTRHPGGSLKLLALPNASCDEAGEVFAIVTEHRLHSTDTARAMRDSWRVERMLLAILDAALKPTHWA